jgi:hypothetical protein
MQTQSIYNDLVLVCDAEFLVPSLDTVASLLHNWRGCLTGKNFHFTPIFHPLSFWMRMHPYTYLCPSCLRNT